VEGDRRRVVQARVEPEQLIGEHVEQHEAGAERVGDVARDGLGGEQQAEVAGHPQEAVGHQGPAVVIDEPEAELGQEDEADEREQGAEHDAGAQLGPGGRLPSGGSEPGSGGR
jgi:hypothetical protein